MIEHPFAPVHDENSRILILGSFPSVMSRENAFYYGHPRNRFWPMLASVFGEETPEDIPAKESLLLRHGLALWDVIASCDIDGSADATVRNAVPVEIRRVTAVSPIGRVLCNGALAGQLYRRYLQPALGGLGAIVLPSTSPANAAWSLSRLQERWRDPLTREV